MHEIVIDESFDFIKTNEYKLSIQVSLDGFSFSVVNSQRDQLLAFNHTKIKISNERFLTRRFREWLEEEKLLQYEYSEVRIIVDIDKYTLVPEQFYSKDKIDEIVSHFFELNNDEQVEVNKIETFETQLLFVMPRLFRQIIQDKFKNSVFLHPIKIITERLPEITEQNGLILLFNTKSFYVVLFNKNGLLMTNSFKITHSNDIVFYVLTVLKQLQILPGKTHLYLAGDDLEIEKTKNNLKKYFGKTDFLMPNFDKQFNTGGINRPLYTFTTLFS